MVWKAFKQSSQDSCWAAALSWWSHVVSGRTPETEKEIIDHYKSKQLHGFNGLDPKSIKDVWGDKKWKTYMHTPSKLTVEYVRARCGEGTTPLLIAYYDVELNGLHANAMWAESYNGVEIKAMDPAYGQYMWRKPRYYGHMYSLAIAQEARPRPADG